MAISLPIIVVENILRYLDGVDKYNAIMAFASDESEVKSSVWSRISLAMDYRFQQHLLSPVLRNHRTFIKDLDLTGIYWIPQYSLRNSIMKLSNLERLNLLGTSVLVRRSVDFNWYLHLPKIKKITVMMCMDYTYLLFREGRIYVQYIERNGDKLQMKSVQCKNQFHEDLETPFADWDLRYFKIAEDNADTAITMFHEEILQTGDILAFTHCKGTLYIRYSSYSLRNSKWRKLGDLHCLKNCQHITSMHVDITFQGNEFLKTIFEQCPFLKKLSLSDLATNFQFGHMEHAGNLEDLTYFVGVPKVFNMDRFCHEFRHVQPKLKRILLHLKECDQNIKSLSSFVAESPKLMFFYLICTMSRYEAKRIQKLFKPKRTPIHLFKCASNESIALDRLFLHKIVPMMHWDMIGGCGWKFSRKLNSTLYEL